MKTTDSLTVIGIIIGLIMLAFYLMDKFGKQGDTNVKTGSDGKPSKDGALPVFWWQSGYDPFKTSPSRSTFIPGLVGDLQMWITSVATDTGLRW